MHSRTLVVIEGVGGGGGVGVAFVVSGVSGVDKYRRTGLGNCGSLGRYASFLKLFKILLECVTPARHFWCYIIMSCNNLFPIMRNEMRAHVAGAKERV